MAAGSVKNRDVSVPPFAMLSGSVGVRRGVPSITAALAQAAPPSLYVLVFTFGHMAMEDWELWACAQTVIRQHGPDAAIRAAMKADDLFEKGDFGGAAVWRRTTDRINRLQTVTTIQ